MSSPQSPSIRRRRGPGCPRCARTPSRGARPRPAPRPRRRLVGDAHGDEGRTAVVGPPATQDLHQVVGVVLAVLGHVLGPRGLHLGVRVGPDGQPANARLVAVVALQLVGHVPVGGGPVGRLLRVALAGAEEQRDAVVGAGQDDWFVAGHDAGRGAAAQPVARGRPRPRSPAPRRSPPGAACGGPSARCAARARTAGRPRRGASGRRTGTRGARPRRRRWRTGASGGCGAGHGHDPTAAPGLTGPATVNRRDAASGRPRTGG